MPEVSSMRRLMCAAVFGLALLAVTVLRIKPVYALMCESTSLNDRWFSPYSASLNLYHRNSVGKINRIEMRSMEWTASAIGEFDWKDSWEGEWRHSNIQSIFDHVMSQWSELPGAAFEFDANDYTFVSHDPQKMKAGVSYDAAVTFAPDPNQPSDFKLDVESEYGWDGGGSGDSLPRDCDWLEDLWDGQAISW